MTGPQDVLFDSQGFRARYLDPDDRAALDDLFGACSEELDAICGLPLASTGSATAEASDPEGDGTLLIGFYDAEDDLVGVLDAVRGRPDAEAWTIGLMLLEPGRRGEGVGRELYRAFERWAAGCGARSLRLGVPEHNEDAVRFFARLGFRMLRSEPGPGHTATLLMARSLKED